MKNSLELKDEKTLLKKRANEMIEKCKMEIRDFSDVEQNEYNSIKEDIEKINEELRTIDIQLSSNNEKTNKNTMEKNFSLLKAIRSVANNKALDELSAAVIDKGASEMRNAGINYVGQIQLPCAENRAAITVASEGEDTVATDLFDVVKPLQAKNVMISAGAKYVTGLVGNLKYPIMGNANCCWENETAKAKNGEPTFKSVELSPKRLATVVAISKQFLVQDSAGAEQAIREEIINAINAKLESTILGNGAGSPTEPKGFFPASDSSVKDVVSDFAKVCEVEGKLEEANVYGNMKYLVSPKAKADLRNMAKGTKSTQLVMENGEVDGTPALCTSHLKNKHVIYGDFSQYIIGMWGNLDITVDNVTLAADGQIRLVVNAYFDAKPLRPEAFIVAKTGDVA